MEILSSLRRRWILTCSMLLLTLAATAFAFIKLPWTYQSQSSVVFLSSKLTSKAYGGNPYLAFNSTLNQTADVVRYETSDVRTVNSLAARGYTSTYLILDALDTAGPVLVVTVTGSNKAGVEHTLSGVTRQIDTNLNALQAGITSVNKIRDVVITFTPNAVRLTSKKARPLTIVLGAGLVLTVAIPVVIDAMLLRRRDRPETTQGERSRPSRELPEDGRLWVSPSQSRPAADPKRRVEQRTQPRGRRL